MVSSPSLEHFTERFFDRNIFRIGEKFLEWTDDATTPDLDTILTNVSLYWFTGSFPRSSKYYPSSHQPRNYVLISSPI